MIAAVSLVKLLRRLLLLASSVLFLSQIHCMLVLYKNKHIPVYTYQHTSCMLLNVANIIAVY